MSRKNVVFMEGFVRSCQRGEIIVDCLDTSNSNDQVISYVDSYLAVNKYAVNFLSYKPADLNIPNVKWNDFSLAFGNASKSIKTWVSDISVDLKLVPEQVIVRCRNLNDLFDNAAQCADNLIKDLSREFSRQQIKNAIDDSVLSLGYLEDVITKVINKLNGFSGDFNQHITEINAIVKLANEAQGINKDKITSLNNNIKSMKGEIKAAEAAIAGLGIAIGASVLISVAAVVAAGPAGLLLWIFTGATIGVSIAFIVINSNKIKALNAKIEADSSNMSKLELDVTMLAVAAQSFTDFSNQASELISVLRGMLQTWKDIKGQLILTRNEIDKSGMHYDTSDWLSVKNDFINAKNASSILIEKTNRLVLPELITADAKISAGMNDQDVSKAVAQSNKMNYLKYIASI